MKKVVLFVILVLSMTVNVAAATNKVDEYSDFLKDNYNIELSEELTETEFVKAVEIILGDLDEYPNNLDENGFKVKEMVTKAVYWTNLDEIANTYSIAKTNDALSNWPTVKYGLNIESKKLIATAIDSKLLEQTEKNLDLDADVTRETAIYMLGKIMESTGNYKNFIGNTNDEDILNKLMYAWNSYDLISNDELQEIANGLIVDGTISGYNIKRNAHLSKSDSERTIVYGHSDIDHARQLIALLNSEDFNVNIGFEPKTSSYKYLKEWGEPVVREGFDVAPLADGDYIAFAKEYELCFEFETVEDKEKFDSLILAYAKKDAEDEPNLLYKSWWQPLYFSTEKIDGYMKIKNNVAYNENSFIQTFSLNEDSDKIAEILKEVYKNSDVKTSDYWVNKAFYGYLGGDYK